LGRIVDVLPRAAPTGPEHGANGVGPLGTGLEQQIDDTARVAGSAIRDPNADAVARRAKRDEDDLAVGCVTDTVPARSEFLDFELDQLFGV
jgi:hypothetical protein